MNEKNPKNDFSRFNTTIGNAEVNYDIKIKSGTVALLPDEEITSFSFDEKNQKIEVVFRKRGEGYSETNPSLLAPDKIWKEIYGIQDGKLAKLNILHGKHTPAHSIEEIIEFDDEPEK